MGLGKIEAASPELESSTLQVLPVDWSSAYIHTKTKKKSAVETSAEVFDLHSNWVPVW